MYKLVVIEDKIKVPPKKFGLATEEAVKSSLEDTWEGLIDKRLGVILSVTSVDSIGEGKIFPSDGSIYFPVTFQALVYQPELHEVVTGYVIDVTEFGAFVRIGPVDGMIHVSQIMDDYVSYDSKSAAFMGGKSKYILRNGDVMRARIISVSMEGNQFKIGLTSRQPGLGVLEWIEKEKKRKAVKKPEAPAEHVKKKRKEHGRAG